MAKEKELPPPLEMACLNALWELGEGNVEEVRVCVSRSRPLAYTTVLTLLDRLSRRGAVSRRTSYVMRTRLRWRMRECRWS